MYTNYIKYPVALDYSKQEIVPIENVTKENRFNFICPVCKNKFIAVINHQTPHFKHKPHTQCSGSLETYLHWLAKEVFKNIESFEVPELFIDDLPEKHRQNFQYRFNRILDNKIPETFRAEFRKSLKSSLTDSRKIKISDIKLEKEFKTNFGDVRIDIVVNTDESEYFIEPFISNPIDNIKKKKLSVLKVPTLSVDLNKFLENFYYYFSINSLKRFLTYAENKRWIYLNDDDYNKNIENYLIYVEEEIELKKSEIKSHKNKLKKISELEEICDQKNEQIDNIREEISNHRIEIISLKNELGIYY